MDESRLEDLRDRLVGRRFYNSEIDEAFTVIGVTGTGSMVLIQYDDGTAWDELAAPELLTDDLAGHLDLDTAGIDDSKYRPLGSGPKLSEACSEGDHDWFPLPSDLGWDDVDAWQTSFGERSAVDTYHRIVRCRRCGLSGDVLMEFAGHERPSVCDRCGNEILPGDEEASFSPKPEWGDAHLCEACTATVRED